jgi:hypothetical protein
VHSESPGLVRSSTDDRTSAPPSDDDRLAAQLRIIALLDRSVKRVHVDMDDFSHNLPATILFWVPEPGNFYQADRQPSLLQILGIHVATLALNFYSALAISVLFLHALSILWIVFGALLTRSRPILRWLHIGSLVWGILTELLPWPCPLTLLENWLESNAGVEPYRGGFLLHYLDKLVYPDISATVLTVAGIIICVLNLGFYGRQIWSARLR